MGRKKIQISRITDERNRQVTFNKRKFGVMKKAYELSVLCDCEIALIIFSSSNKLYQYASTDMDKVLLKYTEYNEPHESLTNKNIIEALNKKEHKNGTCSPDSPEPETDYQLTPRTEAKYSKIDEEFQMMLQRNQLNGNRVSTSGETAPLLDDPLDLASLRRHTTGVAMNQANYSMPVSVPVNSGYGADSSLLQSSPQMPHTSVSPRPSSSENDAVYPSGAMLEMSNGYPNSSSPLGGSPSPGPSPVMTAAKSSSSKQHSPSGGGGGGGRANLRVVIPTPQGHTLAPSSSAAAASEESSRSGSALNTPIVALQTPSISSLAGYPAALSSFSGQDFGVGSDMGLGTLSWGHQLPPTLAHSSSGLPHLAVSSSTPPPSTSPLPVKIKSEPISPPRGDGGGGSGSGGGPLTHGLAHLQAAHGGGHGGGGGANTLPRPSSAGHLTPTPGEPAVFPAGFDPHSTQPFLLSSGTHAPHAALGVLATHVTLGSVTPTNLSSPSDPRHSSGSDYDSGPLQKRPRLNEGWGAT